MFDLIYDWVIHVVPNWVWWLLMTPLLLFTGLLLFDYLWPGALGLG